MGATNTWPRAVSATRSPLGETVRRSSQSIGFCTQCCCATGQVGGEADVERSILAAGEIQHAQVGAQLVHDLAVVERRAEHVPAVVRRVRLASPPSRFTDHTFMLPERSPTK